MARFRTSQVVNVIHKTLQSQKNARRSLLTPHNSPHARLDAETTNAQVAIGLCIQEYLYVLPPLFRGVLISYLGCRAATRVYRMSWPVVGVERWRLA
jgi:hypothetical protein